MAAIGSIPVKLRIRIEAGVGKSFTDIGYADIDLPVPLTLAPNDGAPGASVIVDTSGIEGRLSDAFAAFEASLALR